MEYPKPSLTADMCVCAREGDETYVLLIRRGRPPFAGSWALPGGFAEPGETIEAAAARELLEETGVRGLSCTPVGVFSEPGRDPRGWTVTEAFRAEVRRSEIHPTGQDDAAEARWFRIVFSAQKDTLSMELSGEGETLTATLSEPYRAAGQLRWRNQTAEGLAFDHPKILAAALYEAPEKTEYDFVHAPDRRNTGAYKWDMMRKLQPYLPEDVLPFSVADMEFCTAPEIVDGLTDYVRGNVLGYTGPTDAYFDALDRWMRRRHGFSVQKEQVVLSDGIVPALNSAVRIFTAPGEAVLVPTPVYHPFFHAVEKAQRTLVPCDLILTGDRYEFDFTAFEAAAKRPDVTLCLLSSPHNPIGKVYTAAEIERIASICRDNGVYLVCDEIHHDLILPGAVFTSAGTLPDDLKRNILLCTAPSKTFNIAGLACSNLIFFDPARKKRFTDSDGAHDPNALGLVACRLAYDRAEPWLDALLKVLDKNRRTVETFLGAHLPMLRTVRLEGTYLMWIDCRALGMPEKELMQFLRSRALLHANAGGMFGAAGEGFIRVNIACPHDALVLMLTRLRAAIDLGRITW